MECLIICLGTYFMQHMGSFNYGKIRTMGAVLVAISIPIFNSQLKKARLATNQANARAAYAEAVVKQLEANDSATNTTYTYTVSTASIATGGDAANGNTEISAWTTDTAFTTSGDKLGDKIAKTWIITFGTSGDQIAGISCTF